MKIEITLEMSEDENYTQNVWRWNLHSKRVKYKLGNYFEYKAQALGGRSQSAKTYLEKHFNDFNDCENYTQNEWRCDNYTQNEWSHQCRWMSSFTIQLRQYLSVCTKTKSNTYSRIWVLRG